MIEKMRTWARALKAEIAVLAAAVRDARTPWYAKVLGVGQINCLVGKTPEGVAAVVRGDLLEGAIAGLGDLKIRIS